MAEDILSVIEVAAPRETVWRALVEPELVTAWMGCLGYAGVAGHVFHLQPDRRRREARDLTGAITCRIEVVDPPRRVRFSWGFPEAADTWVDIRLSRIPGGTHVRLVHSGWEQFDDVETEPMRGGLGFAWHTVALPGLKAVAEGCDRDTHS